MKTIFQLTLSLFLAFFFVHSLSARHITLQQAWQRAQLFMNQRGMALADIDEDYTFKQKSKAETTNVYICNMAEGKGLAILSGDDRTPVVLGYTDKDSPGLDSITDGMRLLIEIYERQISALDMMGVRRQAKESAATTIRAAISPMLRTQWHQYEPFNLLCPSYYEDDGSEGEQCPAGCVATAVAQVMNFYQYPEVIKNTIPGYTQYYNTWKGPVGILLKPEPSGQPIVWDQILDKYDGSETDEQQLAVAQLLYWVGLGSKMNYDWTSSTLLDLSIGTLIGNFGYTIGAHIAHRGEYSLQGWHDLLYSELVNGHPIPFSAYNSTSGHTFVIDGYDANGLFHVNWGWNGLNDGFFRMDVLAPDDHSGISSLPTPLAYNMGQSALIGLRRPDDESPLADESGFLFPGMYPFSKMEISRVSFPGSHKVGDSQPVCVDFKNLGGDYYHEVFLFVSQTMSPGNPVCRTAITMPAEGTTTAIFDFIPQTSGTYNVWLATDWDGREVVEFTTVEVSADGLLPQEGLRQISYTVDNQWGNFIIGRSANGQICLQNDGNSAYDGMLKLMLIEGGFPSKTENVHVNINPGETATIDYSFDGLIPNFYYALSVIYESGGNINEGGMLSLGTIQDGIGYWNKEGSFSALIPSAVVLIPEDAVAVDLTILPAMPLAVWPNKNPNTLYYLKETDMTPYGLENANVVYDDVCDFLTLTDGFEFFAPKPFTANLAIYTREAYQDPLTTLVLPFTPQQIPPGTKVMQLAGDVSGQLLFAEVQTMESYTPYLIENTNNTTLLFTAIDAPIAATNSRSMIVKAGTYSIQGVMSNVFTANDSSDRQVYVLNGQARIFQLSTDGDRVNAFRAYLTGNDSNLPVIPIASDVSTGFKNHPTNHSSAAQAYDLQGHPVIGSANGLYIRNGKKHLKLNF